MIRFGLPLTSQTRSLNGLSGMGIGIHANIWERKAQDTSCACLICPVRRFSEISFSLLQILSWALSLWSKHGMPCSVSLTSLWNNLPRCSTWPATKVNDSSAIPQYFGLKRRDWLRRFLTEIVYFTYSQNAVRLDPNSLWDSYSKRLEEDDRTETRDRKHEENIKKA